MYSYREYFITVAAIFLSLALGILIGISFGEDYLVSNQREIIDLMEQELGRRQTLIELQESELQRWEMLGPLIGRAYREALAGKKVAILAAAGESAVDLAKMLHDAGAETALINISPGEFNAMTEESHITFENFVRFLSSGENICVDEQNSAEILMAVDIEGWSWPPDRYLISLGGKSTQEIQIMEKLFGHLHRSGASVIGVMEASQESGTLELERQEGISLVDNIDTIWGEVALLEMLAREITGHYGFGSDGGSLFPPLERDDAN